MSSGVWGFVGVLVGAFVGLVSALLSSMLIKRWESHRSMVTDTYRIYLPEARVAAFRLDVDPLETSDRLIRSCALIGQREFDLANEMGSLGGVWTYYSAQAKDEHHSPSARGDYERQANDAMSEYSRVAEELQSALTNQLRYRTWLERKLLP